MLRRILPAVCTAIGLAWTAGACSGAPDTSAAQRTDSAGIDIVTHSGEDQTLPWAFQAAFTLGGKETEEESFYAVGATMLGVDASKRLYVLDYNAKRVLVFDAEGHHLRTMGSEGGGPGEMRFPITISVAPDGGVAVFDIGKRGFVRFGPDGEILDEQRVSVGLGREAARFLGAGLVVSTHDLDADRGINRDALIRVTGTDTTTLISSERDAGGVVNLKSCGMQIMGVGPIFAPTLRWTPVGADVAATTGVGYDVTIYRDGRPVRILRRRIAPVAATAAMAAARVGNGMQVMAAGGVRTCDAQEVVEQRGVADAIPVIAELAEGPGGTLWIRRAGPPGDPQPTDVFDAEGTYLGSLPPGSPFPAAVLGNRLIAVEKDDMDVERLVVYDLDRGGR